MKFLKFIPLFLVIIFSPLAKAAPGDVAGFVVVARGDVTATNDQGQSRELQRRSKFYSNEVIKTGNGASAQLRFKDRAMMKLKPNTELNISDYAYNGASDPNNKAIMKLVKGGFRTISGTIGKTNKKAYRVDTPAASIGIRGTDYEVLVDQSKVYTAVWSGGISLRNDFGQIDIGMGSEFASAQIEPNLPPVGAKDIPKDIFKPQDIPDMSELKEKDKDGEGPKEKVAENKPGEAPKPGSAAGTPPAGGSAPDAKVENFAGSEPSGDPGEVLVLVPTQEGPDIFSKDGPINDQPAPEPIPEVEKVFWVDPLGRVLCVGLTTEPFLIAVIAPSGEVVPVENFDVKVEGGPTADFLLEGQIDLTNPEQLKYFASVESAIVTDRTTGEYIGRIIDGEFFTVIALENTGVLDEGLAGVIVNPETGEPEGFVTEDGFYIALQDVDVDGTTGLVYDPDGNLVGFLDEAGEFVAYTDTTTNADGTVTNSDGEVVAIIDEDGDATNTSGVFFNEAGIAFNEFGGTVGIQDIDSGDVKYFTDKAIGFVAFDPFQHKLAGGEINRLADGDNVFIFEVDDEPGTYTFLPFTEETGEYGIPDAQHPSVNWGRWSDETMQMLAASGFLGDEFNAASENLPEFFWLDFKPYDPSSLQARTGSATFDLSQLETGGLAMVEGAGGVATFVNYSKVDGSASGGMQVNFDSGQLEGGMQFDVAAGGVAATTQRVNINYQGEIGNFITNSNASMTHLQSGTQQNMSSLVAGSVVDTADAYAGTFSITNVAEGAEATNGSIGLDGMFIMQEEASAAGAGGTGSNL